ncbi:MAG: leucine efflux protein LeuE [Neisseria sp.]|nr:leucine efflux protein LeuE [Neisseria sp.]
MFGITDLPTYIIGTIAVILLPGPNSMYCLAVAGQHGAKTAYRAIGGILLGDSLLMLATAFGAGALLKAVPELFHAVKLIGGLYLAWIGWNLLRGAAKKWRLRPSENTVDSQSADAPKHVFKRALLLSLTNPKAILFFLSFFMQFVDPSYPHPLLSFLMLALILQIISFVYLNIMTFSGSRLAAAFRQRRKTSALGMVLVGGLFIGFAVKLWLAEL